MKTYGQRAFSVSAPRLWNKLRFKIRACSDVNLFKSKLKAFLFQQVYDIYFHLFFFSVPNIYSRAICKLVLNDILMPFFLHCKALRTAMYKRYINCIIKSGVPVKRGVGVCVRAGVGVYLFLECCLRVRVTLTLTLNQFFSLNRR